MSKIQNATEYYRRINELESYLQIKLSEIGQAHASLFTDPFNLPLKEFQETNKKDVSPAQIEIVVDLLQRISHISVNDRNTVLNLLNNYFK